jgi:hypothetical protein
MLLTLAGPGPQSFYFYLSSSWDYRYESPCPTCLLTEGLINFLLVLTSNNCPPISISGVAGITGMCCHWPLCLSLGCDWFNSKYVTKKWRRKNVVIKLRKGGLRKEWIWTEKKKSELRKECLLNCISSQEQFGAKFSSLNLLPFALNKQTTITKQQTSFS